MWLKVTLVLLTVASVVKCLSIKGPRCGQLDCGPTEYCDEITRGCTSCSSICDEKTHNLDVRNCELKCQVFLALQQGGGSEDGDIGALRDNVQRLSRIVTVTLTLVCFILVVLAGVLAFQLYRWKIKKNIDSFASLKNKIFGGNKTGGNDEKPSAQIEKREKPTELRLDVNSLSGTQSDYSPSTVTTSISRKPAEDSALDYSYDNPAMASTPSPR